MIITNYYHYYYYYYHYWLISCNAVSFPDAPLVRGIALRRGSCVLNFHPIVNLMSRVVLPRFNQKLNVPCVLPRFARTTLFQKEQPILSFSPTRCPFFPLPLPIPDSSCSKPAAASNVIKPSRGVEVVLDPKPIKQILKAYSKHRKHAISAIEPSQHLQYTLTLRLTHFNQH